MTQETPGNSLEGNWEAGPYTQAQHQHGGDQFWVLHDPEAANLSQPPSPSSLCDIHPKGHLLHEAILTSSLFPTGPVQISRKALGTVAPLEDA